MRRALKKSPVRMRVLAGLEDALEVLKANALVDRVTVDEQEVIFRFKRRRKGRGGAAHRSGGIRPRLFRIT